MSTLATLTADLRERAEAGESQDSLVKRLYSIAAGLGIRMRNDVHESSEGNTFVGRIILSRDRRKGRAYEQLRAECNGAVIDARTWACLVVPPRVCSKDAERTIIDQALAVPDFDGVVRTGYYDILQVCDGTILTLYCWNHPAKGLIWCLASSNGYDVSHLKWMGDKAYAEIVYELLAAHPDLAATVGLELKRCENDVRLGFSRLDRRRCYTIGFRHPNFHPMTADPPTVWNIQSVDLGTGYVCYSGLPIIPRQAVYTREDIIRLAVAYGRRGGLRMADLEHICQSALEDAKAAIARRAPPAQLLPPTKGAYATQFNYGFILRSRRPEVTGPYSCVLCESPLLRRVRQLVYQYPLEENEELDESLRLEYFPLRAFLCTGDRDDFIALFPQYKKRFATYKRFINNVIRLVTRMPPTCCAARTQTRIVAQAMLAHIRSWEQKITREVARIFVVRPEYTYLYLRAIMNSQELCPVGAECRAARAEALHGQTHAAGRRLDNTAQARWAW